MNWEPAYALLILFSTITTWFCALQFSKHENKKIRWIVGGLVVNFSILFVFKYLNFATESIFAILELCGLRMHVPHFTLLLPVGISFYTFQAVGYMIDVYKKKIEPERNFWTYALFVSFFPQLVAGPIERAKNLLAQFKSEHHFNSDNFIEGLKLMIWGYFMKLCIAENVSSYVDAVYNNMDYHTGTSLILATFFFSFQIFCDFGGYSLIAIGAAKCLGFNLMMNFNHPYLSTSMRDFWRRWHISLSSWFAEYLYIPLGGNRCSKPRHLFNIFATMLVSGIWHGANWTFIFWGGLHGLFQVVGVLKSKLSFEKNKGRFRSILDIPITFFLAMIGWVFFRANTISDAFLAFEKILFHQGQLFDGDGKPSIALPFVLIVLLMFKEIKDEYGWKIHFMHHKNQIIASLSTALMVVLIILCAQFEGGQFIYFQF